MSRLLYILVLCGCAGSLVDHAAFNAGGTPECVQSCTSTPVPGADPHCIGNTCTYQCKDGKLKCAGGCCDVDTLSAGTSHTCAVVAGEARCWGANDKGQLGRAGSASYVPVQPLGVTGTVTAIAAGWTHTCAVVNGAIANGEVWCWGDDNYGQLGDGSSGTASSGPTPRKVASLAGVVAIAAGSGHTCAATATQLFCWGRNDFGQVGDGTNIGPRLAPTVVLGVSAPSAIGLGELHTCALTSSGLSCWGANAAGQLGNGTIAPSTTPSPVVIAASFLGLGANHSCAGDTSKLYCWGANSQDQVYRQGPDQLSPKDVLSNARAVVAGVGHTCAVTTSQEMKCWGLNDKEQLGNSGSGHEESDINIPNVTAAAAGAKHTCALRNGGAVCWGWNNAGQLGSDPANSPSGSRPEPLPVSGL
jgi:alpha-tubulin suppressor-like RCC1 family protein